MLWQQPQVLIGFLYCAWMSLRGRGEVVRYHGVCAVKRAGYKGHSASLGIYLAMGEGDSENRIGTGPGAYTTMHEYGHYLQSCRWGPLYLFVFGIPSLLGATYPEHDANRRAAAWFEKTVPGFKWDENYYVKGTYRHRYSSFGLPSK